MNDRPYELEDAAVGTFRQKASTALYKRREHYRMRNVVMVLLLAAIPIVQTTLDYVLGPHIPFLSSCVPVVAGAAIWLRVRAATEKLLSPIRYADDPRAIGVLAELMLDLDEDVQMAAREAIRWILPRTTPEQARALSPAAVQGLLTVFSKGLNVHQSVAMLNLMGQRHEQRAYKMAFGLAGPTTLQNPKLTEEEQETILDAAARSAASIEANQALLRHQQTLLRPAGDEEFTLLRPAASNAVPEDQLLRTVGADDD